MTIGSLGITKDPRASKFISWISPWNMKKNYEFIVSFMGLKIFLL